MILPCVSEKAEEFNKSMRVSLEKMQNVPKVSTMTIGVVLAGESINLERLATEFGCPKIQDFVADIGTVITMKNKGKNFSNSIVFKFGVGEKKQAVKVFCNGSLHLTGFKKVDDALEVAEIFATLLELVDGGNGISDMYNVKDFNIQLINAYFQMPQVCTKTERIAMDRYYKELIEYSNFYTSYDSDHYAGVILKAPTFTVMTFDSGSIIITSINSSAQLEEAYTYITGFLIGNVEKFKIPKIDIDKKRKRKVEFEYGKYIVLK